MIGSFGHVSPIACGKRGWLLGDDDLDELCGYIDLGFGFDEGRSRHASRGRSGLVETLPALYVYYAVALLIDPFFIGDGGAGKPPPRPPLPRRSSSYLPSS